MNIFSSPLDILDELGITAIVQNENGFIAEMPDNIYRSIPAHSKHKLDYALMSGVDYEYRINNPNKKKSACLSDGQLLHLLTLEPSEFDSRYFVGTEFKPAKGQLHFTDQDGLKKFISQHNAEVVANINSVKTAVQEHNAEHAGNQNSTVTEFEQLPSSAQVGEVDTRKVSAIRKTLVDEYFTLDIDATDFLQQAQKLLDRWNKYFPAHVNSVINTWDGECMETRAKIIRQVANEFAIRLKEMSEEQLLKTVPKQLLVPFYTVKSKKDAVSKYNQEQKSVSSTLVIDTSLDIEEQFNELRLLDSDYLPTLENKFFKKIPNVGNKKTPTEDYSLEDVLNEIKGVFGSVLYEPLVSEQEKEQAERDGLQYITKLQYEHGQRIVDALYRNPDANKVLTLDDNLFEVVMVWCDEHGVLWKGKADILNRSVNILADVKFVNSAEFTKVSRDSSSHNYHLQHAIYKFGYERINQLIEDEELNEFFFIIAEKDAAQLGKESDKPVRVRTIRFDTADIKRALDLAKGAAMLTLKWEHTGQYDGFFGGIRQVTVPAYQRREEELLLKYMDDALREFDIADVIGHSEPSTNPTNTETSANGNQNFNQHSDFDVDETNDVNPFDNSGAQPNLTQPDVFTPEQLFGA